MPSEYVLFCGLHFIKMSNDKDILPTNTQDQERELWLTSSSFRLRFCAQHENIENCTQYSILCPKKLRSGVIKLRTRASWLAPELFLLHLLSTTIHYYLLLSTLPIPVRPAERSAKRRSGSSSTSSSGWSRWQLCYSATMVPNNCAIVPPSLFMKWVLHFLKTSELHILFYSPLLSGVIAISAFCKEQQQWLLYQLRLFQISFSCRFLRYEQR